MNYVQDMLLWANLKVERYKNHFWFVLFVGIVHMCVCVCVRARACARELPDAEHIQMLPSYNHGCWHKI